MRENYWTNSKTNTELGITGPLGSPGAWLRRAYNVASLDDTTFLEGSITPSEISIAGIWYRPAELPNTENHRALYRFFSMVAPEHITRPLDHPQWPAIGVAVAVPYHQVLLWQRKFRDSGATYIWWKTPTDRSPRIKPRSEKARRQLDHSAVYAMLEQGMRPGEIAKKMDFPPPNIDYVAKKWRAGVTVESRRPFLNVDKILADKRAGVPVKELAVVYETTPAYIYRLLGQVKDGQNSTYSNS